MRRAGRLSCPAGVAAPQVAAFQAVNAADIRGRTLHNACGLGVDGPCRGPGGGEENELLEMARRRRGQHGQRAAAGAGVPGGGQSRLRRALFARSTGRAAAAGGRPAGQPVEAQRGRGFAGLRGRQRAAARRLLPAAAGYLADAPSSRRPPRLSAAAELDLLADYGRDLVWGGALQGVTELEERERCKVVDELRRGELSEHMALPPRQARRRLSTDRGRARVLAPGATRA